MDGRAHLVAAAADVARKSVMLSYRVFVTPGVPTVSDDLPPGHSARWWSPISSTLITGARDAVLVDAPTTEAQATALADWVEASGKRLTTIYVTHGHGDHFFGSGALQARFPDVRIVATPRVVAAMKRQISPEVMSALWNKRFPGQIPARIPMAEPLASDSFELEGERLQVVEVGHSDTDDTTCLHVPSLGLVVAGDIAYNDVHQYLSESTTPDKRAAWMAALDQLAALEPRAVVAGHKREANGDGAEIIAATRRYLEDFDALVPRTKSARDLYDAMLERYPDRVNPGALWGSARAIHG